MLSEEEYYEKHKEAFREYQERSIVEQKKLKAERMAAWIKSQKEKEFRKKHQELFEWLELNGCRCVHEWYYDE